MARRWLPETRKSAARKLCRWPANRDPPRQLRLELELEANPQHAWILDHRRHSAWSTIEEGFYGASECAGFGQYRVCVDDIEDLQFPTAVYFSRTLNTLFKPMSIWFCRGVNRVPGALNRMTSEPCFRPASTTPPGFGQLQSAGYLIVGPITQFTVLKPDMDPSNAARGAARGVDVPLVAQLASALTRNDPVALV